jgi:putative acetyltransferase
MVRRLGVLQPTVRGGSVSPTECHTLIELGRTSHLTAGDLSQLLDLDKSTVSRVVARLVKKGLVEHRSDPADQRTKPLALTAAGRRQVSRIDKAANREVKAALELLSPQERQQVLQGTALYAKALERARRQQDLVIRPITPDDDPAVARIIRDVMSEFGAVGEGYSINDPEVNDMASAYGGDRAAYFVIARGAEVLGGGGVGPLAGADPDTCELRKMYLLPELRGLGMGRRLLDRCLAAARDLGYRRVYLETLSHMAQAQALYQANGFVASEAPVGNTGHFACNRFYVRELDGVSGE